MKLKKLISGAIIATMLFTTAFAPADTKTTLASSSSSEGKIYFFNKSPEYDAAWQTIADIYTQKTGVEVEVKSTNFDMYYDVLKDELSQDKMPTLFTLESANEYSKLKEYCMDLSDTDIANWVVDKELLIANENGVYGIPQRVDSYGLIVNKRIFNDYFNLQTRANTGCNSLEDINSFAKLKAVTDDMQANKDKLEIKGVFTCAGLESNWAWRFNSHLLNIPITAEFRDSGVYDMDEISFKYSNNYKQLWDLYITNSAQDINLLQKYTVYDAAYEFARGEAAIFQNGDWSWFQICQVEPNIIRKEDVDYLPIYMGLDGEENQGLCTIVEYNFSINSQVSEVDQKATIEFLEWLYGTDEGKKLVTEELCFTAPYSTFTINDLPDQPLIRASAKYILNPKYKTAIGTFSSFPSQTFKNIFADKLFSYTNGTTDWNDVTATTIKTWASEKALKNSSENEVVVSKIALNITSLNLDLGKTYQFTPTFVPSNSTITWKSSNSKVVTVNNGLVKAVGVGTATITVKTAEGASATCTITVPEITSIKSVTLLPKKTYNLKSKITYKGSLTYKSSNTKVAKIDKKGKITGIKAGKATISVKSGNITVAKINVVVPGITLKKSSATIKKNKTTKIQIKSKIVKGDKVVSYKVDKKKIASVNKKGVVKGLRKGTATITVKMKSGATAKFKVKVK